VSAVEEKTETTLGGRATRRLVLIVDDVAAVRRTIGQVIRDEGFDTIEASEGRTACRILDHASPCLILVDFMMPIMDGLEFLQNARPAAPTVLMTGAIDRLPSPLPSCIVYVLEKPICIAALKKALRFARPDTDEPDPRAPPRLPNPNDPR
jgi:CheY-like chemotaxis protein